MGTGTDFSGPTARLPGGAFWTPTLRSPAVDLLYGVVQADADGGEAHLPLQPRRQPTVQTPRALGFHNGEDGAKRTSVLGPLSLQGGIGFTLNLE